MFLCYDPATWQGREYDNHTTPLSQMNPTQLDTDEWCQVALSWGAKMIIFVAKHTGGFCWWQTDTTEYSVKNIPWKNGKGDLLREISDSCRKFGLKLGVYVYSGDDLWGAYLGGGGKTKDPALQETYNAIYRQQLTEVLTKYGEITEVWFDGSCIIEVGDILEKYAPNAIIFQSPYANIRWAGTEEGRIPADTWSTLSREALISGVATAVQSDPKGDVWAPIEADTTLYDHYWFWSPEKEQKRKSLSQLMQCYYQSVGMGGVLLLNASPNTDGIIPEGDRILYNEFGKELERVFANPIIAGETRGMCLELPLDNPSKVNQIVLTEDFSEGELVRNFRVEGKVQGQWELLAQGRRIGAKRICLTADTTVEALRLVIEEADETPSLSMTAFYADAPYLPEIRKQMQAVSLTYDPETGRNTAQGAGQEVCRWSAEDVKDHMLCKTVSLSAFIPKAGQYAITILPDSGVKLQIKKIIAVLEGIETAGVLTPLVPDLCYNLTRTAAIQSESEQSTAVTFEAWLENPEGGTVFIKPTLG